MSRSLRRNTRALRSKRNSIEAPQLIEHLERRELLVGQVQAVVSGNNLILTGENSANQVEIAFYQGDVAVRPKQGTRINGQRGRFIAFQNTDTVPGSILINMKKGDDTVILSNGLKVAKDVMVNGRQGNDTLALDNAIIRDDLTFLGGVGDDNLSIEDSRIVDDVVVRLSHGDDLLSILDSEVRDDLRVRGSIGDDSVVLDEARIEGHAQIRLHRGNDVIDMRNSRVEGRVSVKMRAGDDSVLIDDSSFERKVRVNLGLGTDEIALGDGDATDDTPASGNVFKGKFVAVAKGGNDSSEVDIDNEFRGVRKTIGFEGDDFSDGATDGAVADAEGVRDEIGELVFEIPFNARLNTSSETVTRQGSGDNRVFATTDSTATVVGSVEPGTILEFDTNGDGAFDDGTVTAGADGSYELTLPLDPGVQTVDVRNSEETSESRQVLIHRVTGRIVRMGTELGDIDIELLDSEVPTTVENFLGYFDRYGDNMIVHRSPTDFVIQGGGFTVDGNDVENIVTDDPIDSEFDDNDRSNVAGTLSMALPGGDPDGGTSQWFINVADNSSLDAAKHTIFGILIGGDQGPSFDVATAINDLDTFNVNDATGQSALSETPLTDFDDTPVDLTGTVSIADATDSLTGTDTRFTSELEVGDQIQVDGTTFFVDSITSDTELTITVTATEDLTDESATTPAKPDESNYVTFSDLTLFDDLANL
ncbi:MAG: peptidylprolyl isomerase [Planctomycetaceae bacterium]